MGVLGADLADKMPLTFTNEARQRINEPRPISKCVTCETRKIQEQLLLLLANVLENGIEVDAVTISFVSSHFFLRLACRGNNLINITQAGAEVSHQGERIFNVIFSFTHFRGCRMAGLAVWRAGGPRMRGRTSCAGPQTMESQECT